MSVEWNAKEQLEEWCKVHYPDFIFRVAKDSGEVCIAMLQPNPDAEKPPAPTNATLYWLVAEYNIWYHGCFTVYTLDFLRTKE